MSNKEHREKLLQLVKETVKLDKDLRDQYQIGEKFRFIRDRLNALVAEVEEELASQKRDETSLIHEPHEDEQYVYVYLYNAQGLTFKTWQKMVSPSVFYEYSVNRPIYSDKTHIEAIIRAKPNKSQHGYLTVIVKKQDILPVSVDLSKDMLGNPLLKVKEGKLLFTDLVSFTHNGSQYIVDGSGELIKAK